MFFIWKDCEFFPNFPKMLLIFPIDRAPGPCPEKVGDNPVCPHNIPT